MSTAIRIENIVKNYGKRSILKGISFTVERGDIFGYLGSNGAGKTTTIRILLDLVRPVSGDVYIMDERARNEEVRRRIGFVLDADGLYNAMSAEENLRFYAGLYGAPDSREKIASLLAAVGLTDRRGDRAGTFSKGMRQRLALARALEHDPDVLILDEPMSGIDPEGQIELRRILLEVAHEQGKTIFFSSHDLDEVQRICNRIALIDRGEIRLYGELRDLVRQADNNQVIIEAPGGVDAVMEKELTAVAQLGFTGQQDGRLMFSPQSGTEVSQIVALLVGRGVRVEGARRKESSLEDLYASILAERERAQ